MTQSGEKFKKPLSGRVRDFSFPKLRDVVARNSVTATLKRPDPQDLRCLSSSAPGLLAPGHPGLMLPG
jgi:hypothetical protein